MRSAIFASLFAFMVAVFARPHGHWSDWQPVGCLNDTDVQTLVNGYTYLLQSPGGPDFNKTALAILSDEFAVYSDSINTLGNRPLGAPAYPSLQVFLATQAQTPPLPVVQTLATFHTCDQISWRWNASGIGSNEVPVRGMITFDVNATTKQINTVYSEFNTAAFLVDLGNPECKQQ